MEEQLVLSYDNRFDNVKDKKFKMRWEGSNKIVEKFTNGSYQLQDLDGKMYHTRENGW